MTKPWQEQSWAIKAQWVKSELDPALASLIPGYEQFFKLNLTERSEISRQIFAESHESKWLTDAELIYFGQLTTALISMFPADPISPLWMTNHSNKMVARKNHVYQISQVLWANKDYPWTT